MTDSLPSSREVFVLLDDARAASAAAPDAARRSRLYTGWRSSIEYRAGESLDEFFSAIEDELAAGRQATGFFSYEFGYAFQQLPLPEFATTTRPVLATVMFFDQFTGLSSAEVAHWLTVQTSDAAYAIDRLQPTLQETEFSAVVDTIQRYIESGDTYQVNFTFPVSFTMRGDPLALYAALRARQPVPYGALAAMPDGSQILSLSPELFVSHREGQLQCKPMKGTAKAHGDGELDVRQGSALSNSTKERAENLMIVDLLRNDLGRIAETGSVTVHDLFAVERFGSVLQMTSTIEARPRPEVSLRECFAALYPCGSITGAPKRRTMQILQSLERTPRGLYTGAIGWFEPPAGGRRLGDFTLSVPIRTLLLESSGADDTRHGVMGVGAGITYDSDAGAEYQECLLKASFLTGLQPGFELFETMHATTAGIRHLDRHLARLSASAAHFGFQCSEADIRKRLLHVCQQLAYDAPHRLRLSLSVSGQISIRHGPLSPLHEPVKLLLTEQRMSSNDHFLQHKTSLRQRYDQGWRDAEAAGGFDTLFFNERYELTEGGRSNVFIRIDGRWFTPPLSAGVLPGVMRSVLLEDEALNASERRISIADLKAAEEIRVCNALRGFLRAEIDWENAPEVICSHSISTN